MSLMGEICRMLSSCIGLQGPFPQRTALPERKALIPSFSEFLLNPWVGYWLIIKITNSYFLNLLFFLKKGELKIIIEHEQLIESESICNLWFDYQKRLKFNIHVEHNAKNISKSLFPIQKLSFFCKTEILQCVYHSLFISRVK